MVLVAIKIPAPLPVEYPLIRARFFMVILAAAAQLMLKIRETSFPLMVIPLDKAEASMVAPNVTGNSVANVIVDPLSVASKVIVPFSQRSAMA